MDMNQHAYQPVNALTLRSCLLSTRITPPWPQLTGSDEQQATSWRTWMTDVLHRTDIKQTLRHASPDLADRVDAIIAGYVSQPDKVTSAGLSLGRYVARIHGRATPFGTMAGVSPAATGSHAVACLGRDHRVIARASAPWLSDVITALEHIPAFRRRLLIVANNTTTRRGDRLVVPFQPLHPAGRAAGTVELSLRRTSAVQLVLDLASDPIRYDDLAAKISAEFSAATGVQVEDLLSQLLRTRALVSNLHAPTTSVDALQHLVDVLAAAGSSGLPEVAPLFRELQSIQSGFIAHNRLDYAASAAALSALAGHVSSVRAVPRPIAVDTRVDAEVVLPPAVLREAASAADLLICLSPSPAGPPAWQRYAQTFFERYGIGTLVPVLELVDPDAGLGYPDGFLSASPEPARSITERDLRLTALAQTAALDHLTEIDLKPGLIDDLSAPGLDRAETPQHLELTFELHAATTAAIDAGRFDISVVSVSRGIGTVTGRFHPLLGPGHQARLAAALTVADSNNRGALRVQLSAPPLAAADAHVARSPRVLPDLISIAEHHPASGAIPLSDLAVATDGYQLRLASISRGCWIEPVLLNAVELRVHTPALARFLNEVPRAQTAVVTRFDWGTAASLPYLPRLRRGRTIVSPATCRITATDLPHDTDLHRWADRLAALREQRRIPARVLAVRGDQRLPLDLEEISHAALLRADLTRSHAIALAEQPGLDAFGWLDGHAHEIVAPLVATTPARGTSRPVPHRDHLLAAGHGHLPGSSRWMTVKLYGHPARQDEILADHLPRLLTELPARSEWWFIRYRDPQPHLRLRIHLTTPAGFGPAAAAVAHWADTLRQQHLLRDLQITPYYPEPGRWGQGQALAAAETIFAADSHTVLSQLNLPDRTPRQVLTASNFVAIASAFTNSTADAMRWLTQYARADLDQAPPRQLLTAAVRLADPTGNWAGLRATTAGSAIADSWSARDQALRAYRVEAGRTGLDLDQLLNSLLHVHHIRAVGIDRTEEAVCLRLARAAALSWTARRKDRP